MRKASMGQGILCVVGFLGLQAFINWMEVAPSKHLAVVGAVAATLLGAWICYRVIGDHYRNHT